MAASLGVAVIGAGNAGRAHAAAYRSAWESQLPALRLVSIADISAELGSAMAGRYGYERNDTSWQAIAEAPDIDVVSVVVANSLHRPIVEGLLRAGKHVLCEKPLSETLDDAHAMAAAARNASSLARVGFTFRRAPAIAYIRDLVQGGSLGKLNHISGHYWSEYANDRQTPISWRFKGVPGSGALADVGSHLSYLAEFIAGDIQSVSGGRLSTVIQERPVAAGLVSGRGAVELTDEWDSVENDDYAAFSASFADGVGSFEVSRIATGHPNTLQLELFFEHGAVTYDHRRPTEIGLMRTEGPADQRGFRQVVLGADSPYISGRFTMGSAGVQYSGDDNFTLQARAFLQEVAGIDEHASLPRCASFQDGVHNMELLDAVTASALAGGTTVSLANRELVTA